jgi:uncharacterized protein
MDLLAGVWIASLLGSAHCAGMCSGFVCLYSQGTRGNAASAHAAYHAGRLGAYLLVGLSAGVLGAAAQRTGVVVGVSRGAAMAAGALMLAFGVRAAWRAGAGTRAPALRGWTAPWMHSVMHRVSNAPPPVRAATIGMLTGLLPCGWLWAFAMTAAGTGRPLMGALVMAVFWAGTVPALLGLGVLMQQASGALRTRLPFLTALLVIALGALTMAGRIGPAPSVHTHGVLAGAPQ